MSLSLSNSSGSYIYFDVIRAYSKRYRSQATQNPVDGVGNISDNITKYNPIISLQGIITGADFNSTKPFSANAKAVPNISVSYENKASNLLPDVIGQFISDTQPDVYPTPEERAGIADEESVAASLKSFRDKEDILTLTEFNGNDISGIVPNCVVIELDFAEEAESGDGIQFRITLQQIDFVQLATTAISKSVQSKFATKASGETDGGAVSLKTGKVLANLPASGLDNTIHYLFSNVFNDPRGTSKYMYLNNKGALDTAAKGLQ